MIQMLKLVLLSCICLKIRSTTGNVLPPQNVSLVWKSAFNPEFSWEPPQHSMINCEYDVFSKTMKENSEHFDTINQTNYNYNLIMDGGFLHFSIKTKCNKIKSKPVVFEVKYPDLVKDLECYTSAAKKAYCSWSPASNATDLQFFYRLVKQLSDEAPTELQKCSSYDYPGGGKTGCHLEATTRHSIQILFNATVNNTLVRNTFEKDLIKVKPPSLNWNITESKDTFNISWIPPDVLALSSWEFAINYTECNESMELKFKEALYYLLTRVPRCKYCISIKARSDMGNTPQSDTKCFDPIAEGFNRLLFAAIFTPLVIAFLIAVSCCCWVNKGHILPKIPKPRDLLSDNLDNNNVSSLHKLYIPAEEEENCCVTLIIDTQTNKPNC